MNFSERYGVCNPFEIKKAEAIANYFDIKLEIVEFDYWRRGPEITEKHKKLMKQGTQAPQQGTWAPKGYPGIQKGTQGSQKKPGDPKSIPRDPKR